jgi:hypothetical protein
MQRYELGDKIDPLHLCLVGASSLGKGVTRFYSPMFQSSHLLAGGEATFVPNLVLDRRTFLIGVHS